jgi:NADPH:quinone reductase-like Zn-dependent oxidoreductase
VRRGELRVLVSRTYPLAQAAEAHREVIAGHADGKFVLLP